MYFIKRAVSYIKKQKTKSILMLVILFVVANIVLAGMTISSATKSAQERTRKQLGADVTYRVNQSKYNSDIGKGVISESNEINQLNGVPTYKNLLEIVNSEYVVSYDIDLSMYLENSGRLQMYNISGNNTPEFIKEGLTPSLNAAMNLVFIASQTPSAFVDKSVSLVDGRMPTKDELSNTSKVVMIEKTLANLNNLETGSNIDFSVLLDGYEGTKISAEVIGIFENNEAVDETIVSYMGISALPQNRIYAPFNMLQAVGLSNEELENLLLNSAKITLNDPLNIEAFKEESSKKVNLEYGILDANDEVYRNTMGPISFLGTISDALISVVVVAGALIVGLITALTVNQRKNEIGMLLAIGESKVKIIGQFIIEVVIIALLAFVLSSTTGLYFGRVVSDKMYDTVVNIDNNTNQILKVDKAKQGNVKSYKDKQGNVKSYKDKPTVEVDKLESKDLDIALSPMLLIKFLLIGLLISSISVLLPSLYVMRFNPKQILTNNG
jgi:putative ABC transport system permease protein